MKIKQIKIEELFGLEKNNFDITCYPNEYITILYAFNGTGKTTLLRLIDAVLDVKLQVLDSIPFKKIELFFDNGDSVCVEKNGEYKKSFKETKVKDLYCFDSKGTLKQFEGKEDEIPVYPISYLIKSFLINEVEEEKKCYLKFSEDYTKKTIEKYKTNTNSLLDINPLFFQTNCYSYFDRNDIETFNKKQKSLNVRIPIKGIFANKDYNRIFSNLPKLEEATTSLDKLPNSPTYTSIFVNYITNDAILIDKSYFEKIYMLLYLEKTNFKQSEDAEKIIDEETKEFIKDQNTKKVPFFLDDKTEDVCKGIKKLINDNKTEEVEKFIDLINKNFEMEFKLLAKDEEEGLVIKPTEKYKNDFDKLPLSILSSGEKNLIVLFYDLMFTEEQKYPNQDIIVFIDEPESSLHILWQNQLLQAVMDIVKEKKNIQVIVATHSAEIVNEYIGLQSPMVSERIKYE